MIRVDAGIMGGSMERDANRLDGWKSIGGHFGRDRTTAMRWAGERGLPVHFLPGGKTRTVFAFRSELDAWARRANNDALQPASPDPPAGDTPDPAAKARKRPPWFAIALVSALICGGGAIALTQRATSATALAMPADSKLANLFVRARNDWASRSADGLARSIREFAQVARGEPTFAPAYADLADAYLLEEENGSLSNDEAFGRAEQLSRRALDLDPRLAGARRALGFVYYWQRHDRSRAAAYFGEALSLDPDDAQTHFWYANILADNGEDGPATREFDRAQLLDPGSVEIATDYAWARWSAGVTKPAIDQVAAILAAHPGNAEAHDCLAYMRLGEGDVAGFVAEVQRRAALRGNPELLARASLLRSAFARGGSRGAEQALLDDEMADQATARFPDHAAAAFLASLAGNRAALLNILALAERQGESWGSAGYTRRIRARWSGDAQLMALLARRAPPRLE